MRSAIELELEHLGSMVTDLFFAGIESIRTTMIFALLFFIKHTHTSQVRTKMMKHSFPVKDAVKMQLVSCRLLFTISIFNFLFNWL